MNFATGIPIEHRIALEKQAGEVITELVSENATLKAELAEANAKVASMERRERAYALARTMEDRSLMTTSSFDEKVAHILRHDDLEKVAHAVDLATDGGTRLATVADAADRGTSPAERAVAFFTNPDEE